MGYWDCRHCGTADIPGSDRACPSCGKPRDNDVIFHPDKHGQPDAPRQYVTDRNKADWLRHNPDWLCSYCSSLNSAAKYTCSSCGHTRSESDRHYFQIHPERKSAPDPAEPKRVQLNASWYCNFCGSQNSDAKSNCSECGRSRYENDEQEEPDESSDEVVEDNNEEDKASDENEDYHSTSNASYEPLRSSSARSRARHSWSPPSLLSLPSLPSIHIPWRIIGIILLVAALITAAVFILIPKERYITVTNVSWQRSIDVEEYRTVRESDWSVPIGGRTQYTRQEIHHYDTVLDHYETVTRSRTVVTGSHTEYSTRDLGNGYFEEVPHTVYDYGTEYYTEQEPVYRQDPVYRTKYYYDIERWIYDHSVTSGAHDKNPYWPEVELEQNERQGSRHENYIVTAVYDEKSANYTMNYSEWEAVSIGDELHVLVHITGYIEIIHDKEE